MGISIYYTAHRGKPLTAGERETVNELVSRYSVDAELLDNLRTGTGYNWESFCIYDPGEPTAPGVIFEGATKLPDNGENAIWDGLQRWCQLLSEIRRTVPSASWRVHVDDHDIRWDEDRQEYDPSA